MALISGKMHWAGVEKQRKTFQLPARVLGALVLQIEIRSSQIINKLHELRGTLWKQMQWLGWESLTEGCRHDKMRTIARAQEALRYEVQETQDGRPGR